MNLETILTQYDAMFGKYSLGEIEAYLVGNIEEAKEQSQWGILISLLNEIIGFCRDTTQKEKALRYCDELQQILSKMHLEGRIDYATSLLNVANAYRAFGLQEESLRLYGIVEKTYEGQVAPKDFMYASLYNNWSLLYQEMNEYEKARDLLLKALAIADSYEEAVMEQATTRTNLAATLLQIGTDEAYEEAMSYLQEALTVFEKDGGRDFHYGAALVAMGDAHSYKKNYGEAARYYEKGLVEIEKHVGRTDNYNRVMDKLYYVKEQTQKQNSSWMSNLERCREFYETYGKEMIHTKFPEYEDKIAVGLLGEGSDCFGFDDFISTDHDYEIGFCMWLTSKDYVQIGASLQKEYEDLVKQHTRQNAANLFLQNRRGAFSVNIFYNGLFGTAFDFEKDGVTEALFENVGEAQLATAVNGSVFSDKAGIFSKIRAQLTAYYPENIWRRKLAQGMHDFSQYAQSNYGRMMARKDGITAGICIGKAVETAMDLTYLLSRTYAPYYKWKKKGLEKLPIGIEILPLLEKIVSLPRQTEAWETAEYNPAVWNKKDECLVLFEQIAELLLQEMNRQGLTEGEDPFLEGHIGQVLKGIDMEKEKQNVTDAGTLRMSREELVEAIVDLEWKQFDKVKNEGGRASCQNNYPTFSIMRKSQYLTWPAELLGSFCSDLIAANDRGWNLIMEKYARMMKSTAPDKYKELEGELPVLSEDRIAIQEEIIKIQVDWMEEFAKEFPHMADNARSIRTIEDTEYETSYETYLRGEISTYSENTFVLYGRFITELLKENRNLAYEIMGNTAKFYGYDSIEGAEEFLAM